MGFPAARIEAEEFVEDRIAKLEATVEHIQSDVVDIKADIRRMDAKMDIGFARLDTKMDAGFARLDAKIDTGFAKFDANFISLKDESKKDLKWMMGVFGGGVLFLAGLMYFLFDRIMVPTHDAKTVHAIQAPAPSPTQAQFSTLPAATASPRASSSAIR